MKIQLVILMMATILLSALKRILMMMTKLMMIYIMKLKMIFQPNAPENLPQYPIDNKMFDVPEQDILNNWEWKHCDTGSSFGPFITEASTIIDLNDPVPELFFNSLFDNRMWTIITEATNSYAHAKSITPQGIYYFK